MSDEPKCGACNKTMTPENSRVVPELFLCDECGKSMFPERFPPAPPEPKKKFSELRIEALDDESKKIAHKRQWLQDHAEAVDALAEEGIKLSHCSGLHDWDFDFLTHEQVVKVMLALPGKWNKSPSYGDVPKIDYSGEIDGAAIRCYQGEPPPNCKVIEVEEDVPAVPATKRLVKKLQCAETKATEGTPGTQEQPVGAV